MASYCIFRLKFSFCCFHQRIIFLCGKASVSKMSNFSGNGYKDFSKVVSEIRWTENYPKPGIYFADLIKAFGCDAMPRLAKNVCQNLFMERKQVIVGVPTRGNIWASILGSAADGVTTIFLFKEGVGTPVPGLRPLFSSSTVYDDRKTNFLIQEEDFKVLQQSDIIWLADDVCESGNTLSTLAESLRVINGFKDVRCIPFLLFESMLKPDFYNMDRLYPVCVYNKSLNFVLPGNKIFKDPSSLLSLRSSTNYLVSLENGTSQKDFSVRVYGPPSMNSLIVSYCDTNGAKVGDIEWALFPGGMPNIHFEHPGDNDVVFIYDATWADKNQDGVVHVLARSCRGKMTVIIPFFPQGTMERVDKEGVVATAQTALHSLCFGMPQTGKGQVELEIYDIHQTGTRFFASDNVRFNPRQFLKHVVPTPKEEDENFVIVFPDGGAASRFKHLFIDGRNKRSCFVFSKIRQDGKRKIQLSESINPGDLEGSTAVIVDDLVRTGGTILETASIVRSLGAKRVVAAFVHADFDSGFTYSFAHDKRLDHIYCSDSNPRKAAALFEACPARVSIRSIFGTNVKDKKPFLALASASEEKLNGVRATQSFASNFAGIWCGSVPSYVSEQPFSEDGPKGAMNRLKGLSWLHALENTLCLSIESFIETKDGPTKECVCCCFENKAKQLEATWVTPFEVKVPSEIVEKSKSSKETVGYLLQKKHNMTSASDWCYFFSVDKKCREDMIAISIGEREFTELSIFY